jgi:hypothetical protein
VTAIVRTLNGVPITITRDWDDALALCVSEFHHVTRDNGGAHYFIGGLYDAHAQHGLRRVDVVDRYARDCLSADRGPAGGCVEGRVQRMTADPPMSWLLGAALHTDDDHLWFIGEQPPPGCRLRLMSENHHHCEIMTILPTPYQTHDYRLRVTRGVHTRRSWPAATLAMTV